MQSVGSKLDWALYPGHGTASPSDYGTGEESQSDVCKVYDALCKQLRGLTDLPLDINAIHGLSPLFRATEVNNEPNTDVLCI